MRNIATVVTSEPGMRKASMFFDDYPRFYDTSDTAATVGRLNLRYEAIFGDNRDLFDGARVLDIASHDGRWSLAALACGAKSVIGIEGKPDLADKAAANLAHYGYGPDRAQFVTGNVHEILATQGFEVDVVLCLGFLYHTMRYNELMHGIRKANPSHVIIDTQARRMVGNLPVVYLMNEGTDYEGNAIADESSRGSTVLTGRPNLAAVRTMLTSYGFAVERLSDWRGIFRDNPDMRGCGDYAKQRRMTIRCISTEHSKVFRTASRTLAGHDKAGLKAVAEGSEHSGSPLPVSVTAAGELVD
jgi:hypothetical protein